MPVMYAHARAAKYIQLSELHLGWSDTIKQTQQFSCGPALVASLSRLAGLVASEYSVLADSVMTETGISLAEFQRLLNDSGFPGSWYAGNWSNLTTHPAAIAAHFTDSIGHFVGILSIHEPYILVIDPSHGKQLLHQTSFQERWSGFYYAL